MTGHGASRPLWARPIPEIRRWATFHGTVVLAVARTLTSTIRLLDATATAFRGDERVQVVFTCDDGSAFTARTRHMLDEAGVGTVPWRDASSVPASLVVTASENVDLTGFAAPVVVLPHGIGFQKYVPDSGNRGRRLSGVVREEFADRPAGLVTAVSHPAQREQLRADHPGLAASAAVIGDHVHDRVRANRRHRERFRAALGVQGQVRLIVLSSTWGPQGLLGVRPDLPALLLACLPYDEYRIAAVLHPNITTAHSPWSVRGALAGALDAGMLLLPPEDGWQAAVSAADLVVGDHGSVTLYAAAADRPVALAAFGGESVPGTAAGLLAAAAPRIDPDGALNSQVRTTIADHRPDRHASIADQAFAHAGEGAERLRALLYRHLGIAEPAAPAALRTSPPPVCDPAPVTAFEVRTWTDSNEAIRIERFPAAVAAPGDAPPGTLRHLSVWDGEPDDSIARSASVVLRSGADHELRATDSAWAADAFIHHPGAFFAAVPTPSGCTAHMADGRVMSVLARPDDGSEPLDACLAASVLYTVLRNRTPPEGVFVVHVGATTWKCALNCEPS